MFSSRTVWYLPIALVTVTLLLYASVGLWFNELTEHQNAFASILSQETIDALYGDERLNHALISLTETVAQASTNFGESYNLEGPKEFGKNLSVEVARLRASQTQRRGKRGFLQDLGNMLSGSGGTGDGQQGQQGQSGGLLSELGNALGLGGGNGTGGLGGLLQGGLSSLGDSIIGGLATPALFLGIGIGWVFTNLLW